MTLTADITYRNMPASDWLDREIQKRVARLGTYCADILSCKVLVEIPHRHHEQGNHFHVRIDLTVPGDRIVAGHEPSLRVEEDYQARQSRAKRTEIEALRKNAVLAVGRAFAAAKRQLQNYARRRRHEVKTHPRARRAVATA
jgi:ribosome-associated translation inhibitor RaiA